MDNKGFTLVELLATITIMGIIMAFAFPSISKLRNQNSDSEFVAYEKTMLYAAKIYYENHRDVTKISEKDLVDAKLIKKYTKSNTDCSKSYIEVSSVNSSNNYIPHVSCKKNGKEVYKTISAYYN